MTHRQTDLHLLGLVHPQKLSQVPGAIESFPEKFLQNAHEIRLFQQTAAPVESRTAEEANATMIILPKTRVNDSLLTRPKASEFPKTSQ